ncbi:AAA family ATPase [Lonepinella sp. MS14436]|uniref:AAA family ATPase n=1 Tax=Lonepinella sp. MS14436 TaxID=3003619 RepID=UPI0036D8515B
MNFTQTIIQKINAGYPAFYFYTSEVERVENILTTIANQLNFKVIELNLAYGRIDFQNGSVLNTELKFDTALSELLDELDNKIILIKNAKLAFEHYPHIVAKLQHLLERIKQNQPDDQTVVILQSAELYIPSDIEPYITLLELPRPTEQDIHAILTQYPIDEELKAQLTTALSGLQELEIQQLMTFIQQQNQCVSSENITDALKTIREQKEQIIAKGGVLAMEKTDNISVEKIGGLEHLKTWLKNQAKVLKRLDEAKEFGVKAPKGTLIAGMPGCGKSLTAKAAAVLFEQPLLRLDMGSLLGQYVGNSEANMRKALTMAESISPCVLWVDELEKAFAGINGSDSTGVSTRLFGYFLTWMQEKTSPVFVIATANDITALPPELLRKGRFDEIFYVGFPNKAERKKIIEIQLNNAKQDPSQFDLDNLAQKCRDYSGADIENAIFEATKNAFLDDKKLDQDTLIKAIRATIPLRKTMRDKVGEYEKKFDELYLSPASEKDGFSIAEMQKMANNPNYLERLKVAESDEVTEDLLKQLASDKEFKVRKAVFSNPFCTTELLDKQLSVEEPKKEQFADNGKWEKSCDEWKILRKEIVKHSNTSLDLALDLIKDSSMRASLFSRSVYSEKEQMILLEFNDNKSIQCLSKLDNLTRNTQERLLKLINDKYSNSNIGEIFVKNESLNNSIKNKILEIGNLRLKRILAENTKDFEIQEKISEDKELIEFLLLNKNLNKTLSKKLEKYSDSRNDIKNENKNKDKNKNLVLTSHSRAYLFKKFKLFVEQSKEKKSGNETMRDFLINNNFTLETEQDIVEIIFSYELDTLAQGRMELLEMLSENKFLASSTIENALYTAKTRYLNINFHQEFFEVEKRFMETMKKNNQKNPDNHQTEEKSQKRAYPIFCVNTNFT